MTLGFERAAEHLHRLHVTAGSIARPAQCALATSAAPPCIDRPEGPLEVAGSGAPPRQVPRQTQAGVGAQTRGVGALASKAGQPGTRECVHPTGYPGEPANAQNDARFASGRGLRSAAMHRPGRRGVPRLRCDHLRTSRHCQFFGGSRLQTYVALGSSTDSAASRSSCA